MLSDVNYMPKQQKVAEIVEQITVQFLFHPFLEFDVFGRKFLISILSSYLKKKQI